MKRNIIYCDTTEQYLDGISGNSIYFDETEIPFSENNIYIPKNLVGEAEQIVINAITREYKENKNAIYLGDLKQTVYDLAEEVELLNNQVLEYTVIAARGVLKKGTSILFDNKYDLYVNNNLQSNNYKNNNSDEFITFIMFIKDNFTIDSTNPLYNFEPIEFFAYKDNTANQLNIPDTWFNKTQYFISENWRGGGILPNCRIFKQNINPITSSYSSAKIPVAEEIIYSGNTLYFNFLANIPNITSLNLEEVKNIQNIFNTSIPLIKVNPDNNIDLYLKDVVTIDAGYLQNGSIALFEGFNSIHIGENCQRIQRNDNGQWKNSNNYIVKNCRSLILDCTEVITEGIKGIDQNGSLNYIELAEDWNTTINLSTCTGIQDAQIWKEKVFSRLKIINDGKARRLTIPQIIFDLLGEEYISEKISETGWTIGV